MVDDYVVRELKREVYRLKDDVEEIDVVEDGISNDEIGRRLVMIDSLVNELIVNSFMGDEDE